jgi:hypothetical protein
MEDWNSLDYILHKIDFVTKQLWTNKKPDEKGKAYVEFEKVISLVSFNSAAAYVFHSNMFLGHCLSLIQCQEFIFHKALY